MAKLDRQLEQLESDLETLEELDAQTPESDELVDEYQQEIDRLNGLYADLRRLKARLSSKPPKLATEVK